MKNFSVIDSVQSTKVDILMKQLKQLKQQERVLMGLYFYEQLSIPDIAEILMLDIDQVQKTIDQIIPKLLHEKSANNSNDALLEAYGT